MGPGEIVEVPIELAQRGRDIEAREGVVEAKGVYISAERLLQIGDRFLLRVPLAIGGDVGHTGGEPANFRVWDEFNGQLLCHAEIVPQGVSSCNAHARQPGDFWRVCSPTPSYGACPAPGEPRCAAPVLVPARPSGCCRRRRGAPYTPGEACLPAGTGGVRLWACARGRRRTANKGFVFPIRRVAAQWWSIICPK